MNKHYYSPETKGFYLEEIHTDLPPDVFEVSKEDYDLLIQGQTLGKEIVYRSRKLKLVDRLDPGVTWDQVRSRRNNLLTKCDWTQMPDAPMADELKLAWKEYRQALRDITETTNDANMVVWPKSPAPEEE